MKEINDFSKWMLSKGKSIEEDVKEYYKELENRNVTIDMLLNKLCEIHGVALHDLISTKGVRKQNNIITRARGHLVKYALLNTEHYTTTVVYAKLFGFDKDHSTAIHHRDAEHFGDELKKYKQLVEYIESHNVIWP